MLAEPEEVTYYGEPALYYKHSISTRTFYQCFVFFLISIILLMCGSDWPVLTLFLAPLIVDTLKPTIILKGTGNASI